MKVGWEDSPLQEVCYRSEDETGEIVLKGRKESGHHLPESRSGVTTGDLR